MSDERAVTDSHLQATDVPTALRRTSAPAALLLKWRPKCECKRGHDVPRILTDSICALSKDRAVKPQQQLEKGYAQPQDGMVYEPGRVYQPGS